MLRRMTIFKWMLIKSAASRVSHEGIHESVKLDSRRDSLEIYLCENLLRISSAGRDLAQGQNFSACLDFYIEHVVPSLGGTVSMSRDFPRPREYRGTRAGRETAAGSRSYPAINGNIVATTTGTCRTLPARFSARSARREREPRALLIIGSN